MLKLIINLIIIMLSIACSTSGSDDEIILGKKEAVFTNLKRGDNLNYTYFSFETADTVDIDNPKSSDQWDLAFGKIIKINDTGFGPPTFEYAGIFTNSGVSGSAMGGGFRLDSLYDNISILEDSMIDLIQVDTLDVDSLIDPAVGTRSGSWYTYNPANNQVAPNPNHVMIIRTADGRYAKVQILYMYYVDPVTNDIDFNQTEFLSFRYTYQPNINSKDLSSN